MGKSLIEFNKKEQIRRAELPVYGETYTVIPHANIIDCAERLFRENNLSIEKETFVNTFGSQVVLGVYKLKTEDTNDFSISYSFTNSYNKQVKFESAVGVHFSVNDVTIISKLNDWKRKHTGTANIEAEATIETQINNYRSYYDSILNDINDMKKVSLDKLEYSHMIGELFCNNIISSSQLNMAFAEYKKPSFTYNVPKDNMFSIYMGICLALKEDHPVTYMQNLSKAHQLVMSYCKEKLFKQQQLDLFSITQETNPAINPNDCADELTEADIHEITEQERMLNELQNVTAQTIEIGQEREVDIDTDMPGEFHTYNAPAPSDSPVLNANEEELNNIMAELEKQLFETTEDSINKYTSEAKEIENKINKAFVKNLSGTDFDVDSNVKEEFVGFNYELSEEEKKNLIKDTSTDITEDDAIEDAKQQIADELSYFMKFSFPYEIGQTFESDGSLFEVVLEEDGVLGCINIGSSNDNN